MTPRASAAPYRIAGVVYLVLIAAGLSSEAVFRAPLSGLADLSALPGAARMGRWPRCAPRFSSTR